MVYELKQPGKAAPLFKGMEDSTIWSCLQGIMGKVYGDSPETPASAMAWLGDFCFFAGKPDKELVFHRPGEGTREFSIMVPQDEGWAETIELAWGEKAKRITRYAIKKEPGVFDREKLQAAVDGLPEGYVLNMIDERLFNQCGKTGWCKDWVANYPDYALYREHGLGAVILKGREPVSGASSYSGYMGGIEVEIDTREDHRRKGLAYICGAKLILECMERGWYPSWDAQNKWSAALAEKLGYHFDREYPAYEVVREKEGKTLYVSDLDGTLLRKDETISAYTSKVINRMTEQGMLFSYATARSAVTAKKVTGGFKGKIPLIVYNGAFIIDNQTGEILAANYFREGVGELLEDLFAHKVYPIVYAYIGGAEKFSYVEKKCSKGMLEFIATRSDGRKNPVEDEKELSEGDCFYITCIDSPEKLFPLYERYKGSYHCVYQRDIYSGEQWLEIMPETTTKANGVLRLKEMLKCSRTVVFGDGLNDLEMFGVADESYAVANAVRELKQAATGVIGGNDEDGVARWLEERAGLK